MSVLEARDLTVRFRQRGSGPLTAVDHLSMELRAGQTLALVGESGSGKSTVVRALSQLLRPAAGQILIDGQPAGRRGAALRAYRRRVQLIFQDPYASLNPMHTIHHHLARPLRLSQRLSGAPLDQAVQDLLRSVNLTPAQEIARKHPHELSGGQRQRVAIARALATGPDVLLADEPVSMLDVSIRLEILNLLDTLKRDRNLALLYVTHDLATARHFAAEIMVMYRGEIVERGPADEVILRPAHPYTR
ncbi:MAG TPA: ATP-binding cassette domain-containing protein, partial [Streptosporangiaceae bacterium]